MDTAIKISPEEGELKRQTLESWIKVDPDAELELRHLRALSVLGSVGAMDLTIPENAQAADRALEQATDLLAIAILDWHWLNRNGAPLSESPHDNPSAFGSLSMAEINWLLEQVSEVIKETSASKNS